MIYLAFYVAVGVITLLGVLGYRLLHKSKESQFSREYKAVLHPERKTLSYRAVHSFLIPVSTAVLIVLAWPVAIVVQHKLFGAKTPTPVKQNLNFVVARCDLTKRVSIKNVEERERVNDPLVAVPDLPFGHLHTVWESFLQSATAEDELWEFVSPRAKVWPIRYRAGYVLVRGEEIGRYHLTVLKGA